MDRRGKTKPELLQEIAELEARINHLENSKKSAPPPDSMHASHTDRLKETERLALLGHWEFDYNKNQIYCSDELFKIFEVSPESFDMTYESYLNLIHPDDRQVVDTMFEEALEKKTAFMIEHRIALSGGRIKNMLTKGGIVFDDDGNPLRAVGTSQDITFQRRNEEKLKHLNMVYNAVRSINKLIVKERNRSRLIRGVCENLTKNREYEGVWIILLGADYTPVDFAGAGEEHYFNPLRMVYEGGQFPDCVKKVLESDEISIINDFHECGDVHQDEKNPPQGNKNLTVRLEHEGSVYGILHAHLPQKIAVDEDEKSLFLEVAGDVAFALDDIAEGELKQQMAENLQKKEARLEEAENIGKLGYWEYDLKEDKTTLSDNLYNILGYEPREYEHGVEGFLDMVNPVDQQNVRDMINYVIDERKPVTFEFRFVSKDGGTIWVEARYHPKMVNGILVKVFGTNQDITERKTSEKKLAEATQLLRATIESTIDGILVVSNNWEVLARNRRFLEMWKIPEHMADTQDDQILLDYAAQQLVEPEKYKARIRDLHNNKDNSSLDIVYFKDGRVFEHYTQTLFINGKPSGRVWSFRDVTSREKREKDLEEARRKAEESDRLKSAFLANISHEIRTPMNGIMGFTEMLKDSDVSLDEQEEFINNIEKSGNRMLATVNDLVDISKIEAGQVSLSVSEVYVNQTLDEVYNLFKKQANDKGLQLIVEKAMEDDNAVIHADSTKFYEVLSNLVKNAIKFTEKGVIRVGYELQYNHFKFFVEDTGIGIAQKHQESIFQRFIQADLSLSKKHEGSGIGLSIVKAYVEMMGGEIWLDSREGEGAVFYFTIPVNDAQKAKKEYAPQNKTTNDNSINDLNILIVDDEESSEELLRKLLEKQSKKLLYARDGQQAIIKARENPMIDLILMDIKMPVMDGYEATRKIREFNKDVKIIAQSANAMDEDRQKALNAGCDEYITKPLKRKKLYNIMSKLFSVDGSPQGSPQEN